MIHDTFSAFWATMSNTQRVNLIASTLSTGGKGLDESLKLALDMCWTSDQGPTPAWINPEVSPAYYLDNWLDWTAEVLHAITRDMDEGDCSSWEHILDPHVFP